MDLVVLAPHRRMCMSASWLSSVGDTIPSEVDHRISYVVRGAPYGKLGRRPSRELDDMGISTRRMPRHSLLEGQADSDIISCRYTGSNGLGRPNYVLKEKGTRFSDLASWARRSPRSLDQWLLVMPWCIVIRDGLRMIQENEDRVSLSSASRSG